MPLCEGCALYLEASRSLRYRLRELVHPRSRPHRRVLRPLDRFESSHVRERAHQSLRHTTCTVEARYQPCIWLNPQPVLLRSFESETVRSLGVRWYRNLLMFTSHRSLLPHVTATTWNPRGWAASALCPAVKSSIHCSQVR